MRRRQWRQWARRVGPGDSYVVRARMPGLACLAGLGAASGLVLAVSTGAVNAVGPPALIAALWAGQLLIDRGRVRRVELTALGDMVLTMGGGARRFARSEIGAVGCAGTVIAGRLSAAFGGAFPGASSVRSVGRVVLLAPDGTVRGAWRAGWLAVSDLEAACRAAGIPWVGTVDISTSRLAPPAAVSGAVTAGPGREAVSAAYRGMRRRSRVVLVRSFQAWCASLASTILVHAVDAPRSVVAASDAVSWTGGLGMLFLLGTQRLRSRAARTTGRAVERATWSVADVAVVAGAPADPTVRVVVVLDPELATVLDTWLVDPGGTSLWLQERERRHVLLAEAPDGRSAVAMDDRAERLALLRRSVGLGKSADIHRWARAQPSW